ncbi:uncharacterized protein LOC133181479 [Saccostrea echinata]|uniref:uncharacterized protein LOC133181479 n=1 Tax=Saccostrea echinata TaxID=191078 RepID=UPI002A820E66|nr:uncharacterized protein LOC133181479 [Saccostrea echinata]
MGFPGCTGGFSFEVEYSQSLFKKKIEVTDDCKVQKRPCIKFNRLKMNCENQTEYEIYTIAEKSLMMADRLAVVGFYHREEPKVSKWEFLNNFTLAEIKNIMKPVLQRAKSEAKIPVGNLSSSLRKKGSASDFRTSSTGIGILGGSLLGVMFLVIFVSDIVTLKIHLRAMFRNVYHFVRKVTGNLAED